MTNLCRWSIGLACAVLVMAGAGPARSGEKDLESRLRAIPKPLIDSGLVPSVVIGVLDGGKRTVVGCGSLRPGAKAKVDGDTPYEIGSITKVFTGTLLADLARRKLVALDDPLRKYVPADVPLPPVEEPEIRLVDLATHTSGLPRLPDDFVSRDPDDPYADYSAARMWAFVARHGLSRPSGAKYAYSNLGVGLLGLALEKAGGASFDAQVRAAILTPLGMRHTGVEVRAADLPAALDGNGRPIGRWRLGGMTAAGALCSTANDLLTFAAAQIDPPKGIAETLTFAREPRVPGDGGMRVGLGWHVGRDGQYFHSGETGGFHSVLTVDVAKRRAVVVLAAAAGPGAETIAGRVSTLLDGGAVTPIEVRPSVTVPETVLESYVGRYALSPQFAAEITREGGLLFAQATAQPRIRLYAASPTHFFYRAVEAELDFEGDGKAPAAALVLHQGGRDLRFERVDPLPPRKVVEVPAATLARYAGRYTGNGLEVTVLHDAERILVQLAGQPTYQVFPTSPTRFEYDVVQAALTFETGETGPATAVVLEQGGRDLRFERAPDSTR